MRNNVELMDLFKHIKEEYPQYQSILQNDKEMEIVLNEDLHMKVKFYNFFNIYFNDFFYYDIDPQDVIDFVDDIFSNNNIICVKKKWNKYRVDIVPSKDYIRTKNVIDAWTLDYRMK